MPLRRSLAWTLEVCLVLLFTARAAAQNPFRRGDANCDGCVNCADVEFIIHYLPPFSEAIPCCLDAMDADFDHDVDLDDAAYIAAFILDPLLNPPPPDPGPTVCGPFPPGPPGSELGCTGYPQEGCSVALPCDSPSASIAGPGHVVLLGGSVDVAFDGSGSRGTLKGAPRRFTWAVEGPGATVLRPHEAVTVVRFTAAGDHKVKLDISPFVADETLGSPADTACAFAEMPVSVSEPFGAALAPRFVRTDASLLTALAGRDFRVQLVLSEGSPPPAFSFIIPPPPPDGLALDPATGELTWAPGLADLGVHDFAVMAANAIGADVQPMSVRVLDPAHAALSYAPTAGGGGGGGVPQLETAPPTLEDGSPIPSQVPLVLGSPAPSCAVQRVTSQSGPVGLRFDPTCADPVGSARGGVYSSASTAIKAGPPDVAEDFTIELWLSNVPPAQLGDDAAPAFIFAASNAANSVNWMVGAAGNGKFVASVSTTEGSRSIDVSGIDLSGPKARQLAFVKSGTSYTMYVDGAAAASAEHTGSLSAWDPSYRVNIGNSVKRDRPFTGDVHLCAFYSDALGPEVIELLSRDCIGPTLSDPALILAPRADICPDPREVGRGELELDGRLSGADPEMLAECPRGGGGGGGAASLPLCGFLRDLVWAYSPGGVITSDAPYPDDDPCPRDHMQAFHAPEAAAELTVTLTVHQVPIRGEVRSASDTWTGSLSSVARAEFRRGDANSDAEVDISDPVFILQSLFLGGPLPSCADAADSNDDGAIDLSDAVFVLQHKFLGGAPPPEPYPGCGLDASVTDTLGCITPPCP